MPSNARVMDKNQPKNIIGHNVRKFRVQKGWSQQLLSDKLELVPVYIHRDSISLLENCKRMVTDFEIAGLAETLGVSVADLFAVD